MRYSSADVIMRHSSLTAEDKS